jgi:lipopolysaccharide transport system permease protein
VGRDSSTATAERPVVIPRNHPTNPVAAVVRGTVAMVHTLTSNARLLGAITRVELSKKYAGSVLGMAWVLLQPALLLSVYLFVYLVVFPVEMRSRGLSRLGYVLYVFCGLIPYLGTIEAITLGAASIKQNIHLVKNVMLPIELVPVRSVLVASATQAVGMAIIIVLSALNGTLTVHLLWLPLAWSLQIMMLFGLTWIIASIAVALPDISYFINLFLFLLMWVSPIGFTPDMVPPRLAAVLYLNPVYYLLDVYRDSLMFGRLPPLSVALVYVSLSLVTFAIGSAFFRAFRGALLDYE